MSNLAHLDSPICLSNADFARNLRRLADQLDCLHPEYSPQHMMVLILDSDSTVQRESYGQRDFNCLHAVAMLEWAKLAIYEKAKCAE